MNTAFLEISGAKGFALIDEEDYEKVSSFKWRLEYSGSPNRYYIGCRIGSKITGEKCFRLSHMVLGVEHSTESVRVKFLNKNRFDLRKANLKIHKFISHPKKIGFLQIGRDKSRKVCSWYLSVYLNQKNYRIGYYKTEDAVRKVTEFIKDNKFPLSDKKEIEKMKLVVRRWALEKGYTNPSRSFPGQLYPKYKVGDKRITKSGFVQVKTETGWKLKHHLVWKESGKRIPKKHKLLFKDGDKRNFEISNLELVSPSDSGYRLSIKKHPKEIQEILLVTRTLQKEIDKQSKKKTRLLKVAGTENLAVIDTSDYERVEDFEWQLLKVGKKNVVGYRTKIGERKYKIITPAHKILEVEDERVRIKQINNRLFDYRQKNLYVHYFDRSTICNSPSYYIMFVKNRKGAKSKWKVDIRILGRRTTLGYYISKNSAQAAIGYAKDLNLPLTNFEEFKFFRNEIRKWAIENGHANKSKLAISYDLRQENTFNYFIRLSNRKSHLAFKWAVSMRNYLLPEKRECLFGFFKTEEIAKAVVTFSKNCELPVSSKLDIENLRLFVRSWATAKGYLPAKKPFRLNP